MASFTSDRTAESIRSRGAAVRSVVRGDAELEQASRGGYLQSDWQYLRMQKMMSRNESRASRRVARELTQRELTQAGGVTRSGTSVVRCRPGERGGHGRSVADRADLGRASPGRRAGPRPTSRWTQRRTSPSNVNALGR
jgi:hypothetical protein